MAKTLRDLFSGVPKEELTLRDVAHEEVTERTLYEPELPDFTARLPGDNLESHPKVQPLLQNPFRGKSVLQVSRDLREGLIPPGQERYAREWIGLYEKFTGETVYSSRNHDFVEPEATGESGLHRADPWPYDGR